MVLHQLVKVCFTWLKPCLFFQVQISISAHFLKQFAEHEAGIKQKHQLKSVSKCKSEKPIYKRTQQVQEFVGSNSISPSSHYSKNKKAVQQTRQLLFDCVREVVEKHKKESEGQQIQGILRPEQLWELICENLYVWSKESINETNIKHLVCYDVLASTQEWNDLENQTKEIGSQLGDAILEDIINEITTEISSYRDT